MEEQVSSVYFKYFTLITSPVLERIRNGFESICMNFVSVAFIKPCAKFSEKDKRQIELDPHRFHFSPFWYEAWKIMVALCIFPLGIQGVPGNGRLSHLEDLILVCTSIMFTCTVQHSATNYSQYEEFGFPPNYPALLNGEPPIDKVWHLPSVVNLLKYIHYALHLIQAIFIRLN